MQAAHDCLYSHLISTSQDPDAVLRILGQVIVAEGMPSDVDIIGSPANTSSSDRIEAILELGRGDIARIVGDLRLMLQVGSTDQDIKILDPIFRDFLLDRSRSQRISIDINDALLILRHGLLRVTFETKGM